MLPSLATLLALGVAAPGASPSTPTAPIFTVAGTGAFASAPEPGTATDTALRLPLGVAPTADGGFLIAETGANRIRHVASDGSMTIVAGTGAHGFAGDGGPATRAALRFPGDVAPTADGGFLIADSGNHRIRRVAPDGTIATVAGSGRAGRGRGGFAGDGGPATAARLAEPSAVTEAPGGTLLIADTGNDRVRRVTPDGRIATVAGTGRRGFAGDGGPAKAARLNGPESVAVTADGDLLIADSGNDRIRRVTPAGRIATIAGSDPSRRGGRTSAPAVAAKGRDLDLDAGDGREATAAALSFPGDVAPTPDGGLLIVDTNHYRVRFVALHATDRLAVAIVGERLGARRCAPAAVRVVATGGGEGRLDLRRGDRRVARVVTALGPGTTVLTFGRAPLPAGVYRLRLRAEGLGAVAIDRAQLTVPRCRGA